jgi:REP element-mobilizing transposase RayT
MKNSFESQQKLLYLVEFGPVFEKVLEQIAVQHKLEAILYEWAQTAGLEIDSCDVLPDYVAMTFYLKPLVDVDHAIVALKKYSSDALLQEFGNFQQFVADGSLWEAGYDVELL